MRGREPRDPDVIRRFAAVWPDAGVQRDPLDPSGLPGLPDPTGLPAPVRPDGPGRRDAEAAWRELDAGTPAAAGDPAQQPALGVPDAGEPSAATPPPLPPPGRSALGSFDPGRRGVRVLAVVAVLVVLVAGYLAWQSQPRAEPVPVASSSSRASTGVIVPAGLIVVAVQGRVARPGLYRLPPGSRVADALAAAGGPLPGVDLSFVNLARKVSDGELILVAATPPPEQSGPGSSGSGSSGSGLGGPGPGGKVDLNTASLAQLDALPGVGPALAQRILDFRTEHDGFRSVDELRRVTGIGDVKFAQLKDLVTV